MPFSDEQTMLTLAALTYRGFMDVLPGSIHNAAVREAFLDGLNTFAPVKGDWALVWGPATTREVPLQAFHLLPVFDWNAMFVVRQVSRPNRFVVAIRGTNPVAAQDWLFGDFWTGTTVKWPFSNGDEAISTSTALGLSSLQHLRSVPSSKSGAPGLLHEGGIRTALDDLFNKGQAVLNTISGHAAKPAPTHFETEIQATINHWVETMTESDNLRREIQKLNRKILIKPAELRPKLLPKGMRKGPLDLLTFLQSQVEQNGAEPLEVVVTGHSKGGALAFAVSMWLAEALNGPANECWDDTRRSTVSCYAFAGPTAGNGAFANRIDSLLQGKYHAVINENDLVPRGFDVNMLRQIPDLFGARTNVLTGLVNGVVSSVAPLNYQQPALLRKFTGQLDPSRPLGGEVIQQHLDAYLMDLGLFGPQINAFTCFV
jgi:hypothetical protein